MHNWRYEIRVGESVILSAGCVDNLGQALDAIVASVRADPFLGHYGDQTAHPGYKVEIGPLHVQVQTPEAN